MNNKTPFTDATGNIKINLVPLYDHIFVYKCPIADKIGVIQLPEEAKSLMDKQEAIILATGPGYYVNGIYVEMPKELKPGVRIKYNSNIPFFFDVKDVNGKDGKVQLISARDVYCIVKDE